MPNLTIKQVVVVIISLFMVIAGIFLVLRLSEMKDVLHELPVQEQNNVIVEVEPSNSQQGTLFSITANYFGEKEQQDLRLIVEKEKESGKENIRESEEDYASLINLYDDGEHYDKESKDSVYAGFFDSKAKPLGKYNIRNKENGNILASFVVQESKCEVIQGVSNDDKINFVILPSNYNNYSEFKDDAKNLLTGKDSLLSIEPFNSNKNKLSFSIVNTTRDLNCKIGCYNVSTLVCCDNKIVSEEASRCHHDSIIVLINSKKLCGSASYYAKICSKNELSNLVLVHEIGHSFADLADEYVYSEFYNYSIGEIESVNCDKENCEKWKNITDGCFKGCTYPNLYRPAEEDSIMYQFVPVFNRVCTNHIEKLMENYTKNEKEMERALPNKESYFVNLKYDKGKIEIGKIFLKPIKSNLGFRKSDYSAEIRDFEGKKIFETILYLPDKIFPIPNSSASAITQEKFSFSLILPYYPKAERLIIYKYNKQITQESLAAFSQTCGNSVCEKTENHLSCSADCSIKDNFCETSVCDPDCESQKNCERNKSLMFWFSIFLILGALILILIVIIRARK